MLKDEFFLEFLQIGVRWLREAEFFLEFFAWALVFSAADVIKKPALKVTAVVRSSYTNTNAISVLTYVLWSLTYMYLVLASGEVQLVYGRRSTPVSAPQAYYPESVTAAGGPPRVSSMIPRLVIPSVFFRRFFGNSKQIIAEILS